MGLSKKILTDFNGEVPITYEGLESLPGVGHKTASVVMSQAFGTPAFAVDTHVHRLALRWGLTTEKSNVNKVQLDLCRVFPHDEWDKVSLNYLSLRLSISIYISFCLSLIAYICKQKCK